MKLFSVVTTDSTDERNPLAFRTRLTVRFAGEQCPHCSQTIKEGPAYFLDFGFDMNPDQVADALDDLALTIRKGTGGLSNG